MEYVTLANGIAMPVLGYGVYQIPPEETEACVAEAIRIGYRSFDTAQAYRNEAEVGAAIRSSGIPRTEFFITSKVWISDYGYDACRASVLKTLEVMGLEYIDLMLLHQPFGDIYGAWRALEDLYNEGKIRAIGVSNFYPDRLVDLCAFNRIRPMVNQVELHPLFQQTAALETMRKYGVTPEAWAPLGEAKKELLTDPILTAIGAKYKKTAAQIALRWNIDRGVVVLPKSVHTERMEEDFNILDFKLSEGEMASLEALDQEKSLFLSHTDPATVEMFVSTLKPAPAEEAPAAEEVPAAEEPTAEE